MSEVIKGERKPLASFGVTFVLDLTPEAPVRTPYHSARNRYRPTRARLGFSLGEVGEQLSMHGLYVKADGTPGENQRYEYFRDPESYPEYLLDWVEDSRRRWTALQAEVTAAINEALR